MTGATRRQDRQSRSVARLAAVQALYQRTLTGIGTKAVIDEFFGYRLNAEVDGVRLAEADIDLFADIVRGVDQMAPRIDEAIAGALLKSRSIDRLEAVLAAILRAGAFELMARLDVPAAVVIDEYVEITKSFFDAAQSGFVNGVLDRLARELRPDGSATKAAS